MLLYILAGVIGALTVQIYHASKSSTLDTQIFGHLKAGRQVIICIDNDATIMQMTGDKIKISKAETDFYMEEENEHKSPYLVSSGPDQSSDDDPPDLSHT